MLFSFTHSCYWDFFVLDLQLEQLLLYIYHVL